MILCSTEDMRKICVGVLKNKLGQKKSERSRKMARMIYYTKIATFLNVTIDKVDFNNMDYETCEKLLKEIKTWKS